MTSMYPHPVFDALADTDWDDTESILTTATPVFDALTRDDRALLLQLLDRVSRLPELAVMCEGYDFMRKLVLHADPVSDVRLRLHLYSGRRTERPHNHRWPFASHILCGHYRHNVYGTDSGFDETINPAGLKPILTQCQRPGDTFAIHHTCVHNVCAEPGTLSMILRGPAAKTRFLIHDTATGKPFHVYGASQESPTVRAMKQLAPDELTAAVRDARSLLTDPTNSEGPSTRE